MQRAFSAATGSYDEHAVLQREIADRPINHLSFTTLTPKRILDVGCGTGYCTRLLRAKYKKAGYEHSDGMIPIQVEGDVNLRGV